MDITPLAAAASGGADDLLVGLLIGLVLGVLAGPALRSWLTFREWVEASREAQLSDRLLTRLAIDAGRDEDAPHPDGEPRGPRSEDGRRVPAWRTRL